MYVEGEMLEYDRGVLGGGMSLGITIDFACAGFGYCTVYDLTHNAADGQRRVCVLNNYDRLEHRIKYRMHIAGVHVNEVLVGKLRPGSNARRMDYCCKCLLTLERSVRECYGMHTATIESSNWDVELTRDEKVRLSELCQSFARCIVRYVMAELDIEVEAYRVAKGRYQLLPADMSNARIKHNKQY